MLPYLNDSKEDKESIIDNGTQETAWYHVLLLNRPLKVVATFLILAIVTPVLIYHFLFLSNVDVTPVGLSVGSCLVPRANRLPCGIGEVNSSECHPQCCYDLNSNVCFHRFPSRFSFLADRNWSESLILQPRVPTVPFGQNSLPQIRLAINEISSTHLSLTFYNSLNSTIEGNRQEEKNYTYMVSSPEIQVIVNGTDGTIFNTARGPLIASNNIWEMSFILTNDTMYGLGEIPLKEGVTKVLYKYDGGLSSVPLIIAKSNNTYHGLLIDVKDPVEVRVHGEQQIAVRCITNLGLKFHLFVGPSPKDVMRDVMSFIGYRNELEYWMLGAHVCSELPESPNTTLSELKDFLTEAASANLPYESHCGIGPIILNDDECDPVDDDKDKEANAIRLSGKKYVPLVSPYLRYEYPVPENETSQENDTDIHTKQINKCSIASQNEEFILQTIHSQYTDGDSKDIWEFYQGLVDNRTVIYPYYENVTEDFMHRIWKYNVKIDGVILHNDWPLDESLKNHNDTYHILPYYNQNFVAAFNNTPQWNISRSNKELYINLHNEYGNFFAKAFKKISGDTPMWVTSNHMNADFIVNRQSVDTSWTNLHRELVQAAIGGVSGHWLWSSPICGDTENFDRTLQIPLCVKWYMAATYMPMIKIHSKNIRRDPLSFTGTNKAHIMAALNNRLRLMPYFYTTLQQGPLLRPMFYQFPLSANLTDLNTQFSVGEDLIIVPNLEPFQTHVRFWMPPGQWYEMWGGLPLIGQEGEPVIMTTTEADFLNLIRGGSIIVMQTDTHASADETRLFAEFSLKIALYCETTETEQTNTTACHANGKLYMAKNSILIFEADSNELRITLEGDSTPFCSKSQPIWGRNLKQIAIYGLDNEFNNMDHHRYVEFSPSVELCQLEISNHIVIQYFTYVVM